MKEFGNIVYGADVRFVQSDQTTESEPIVYATRFGNYIIIVEPGNDKNKIVIQSLWGDGALFYSKDSLGQNQVSPGVATEAALGQHKILIKGNAEQKVNYISDDLT